MNGCDAVCKGVASMPIGPNVSLRWRIKANINGGFYSYENKLVIVNNSTISCIDLYSKEEFWSFRNKKIGLGLLVDKKFLFKDYKNKLHAFDWESGAITKVNGYSDCLVPVGFYKNYMIEEQVLDISSLEIITSVPELEWSGSIGEQLIAINERGELVIYNLLDKSLITKDINIQGMLSVLCFPESKEKIIVIANEKGYIGYSFPDLVVKWTYLETGPRACSFYTERLIGYSNEEETRFCILDKHSGKKIFDDAIYRKCFITGDKYLWSESLDRKHFVCHDIHNGGIVGEVKKEYDADVIIKVVNDCLLVLSNEDKELICYRGNNG